MTSTATLGCLSIQRQHMAIQVRCSCGKELQAKYDDAGNSIRCPSCGGKVKVPEEPEESSGYGLVKIRKCPSCSHEWPRDAVVCVDCGYNFETGRKMRTKVKTHDREVVYGRLWLGTYAHYRVFRGKRGQPCLNVTEKFLFIPTQDTTYNLSNYNAVVTDFKAAARFFGRNNDCYFVQLEGPRKKPVSIFSSPAEHKFKELVDLLSQAGRLSIKRK